MRMFDSVNPSVIPPDAEAVAGYTAGNWPTFSKLAAGWPNAHRLSIVVAANLDADCLDIEKDDARPEQAAGWVKRQQARGLARPVVYASTSVMPTVLALLAQAGIPREQVRVWSAHYTYSAHRCGIGCRAPFTADATQWTDRSMGRNLDESLVADDFFTTGAADMAPDHQPIPLQPYVSDCACPTGGAWVLAADGSVYAFGGAPFHGAPVNDAQGENWKKGNRQAAHIEATGHGYTVIDTLDERFTYGA